MSRRLVGVWVALATVVVLAGVATVVWWQRGGSPPAGACDVPTTLASGDPGRATAAPDGSGIRVVEKGFSQEGAGVSLGAVLENTSGMVAYRTRVVLRALDAQQQPATYRDSPQLAQEIPIILPGQRIGVGSFAYTAGGAAVASFEVELQAAHWMPREAIGAGFTGASGAFERINRFDTANPADAYIDYTVTVSSCRALESRMVAAVYRDAKGAIVGGTLEASRSRGQLLCEPGSHADWISADGLPSTVDPARTEFHPYCDIAPKPVSLTTDAPWN